MYTNVAGILFSFAHGMILLKNDNLGYGKIIKKSVLQVFAFCKKNLRKKRLFDEN